MGWRRGLGGGVGRASDTQAAPLGPGRSALPRASLPGRRFRLRLTGPPVPRGRRPRRVESSSAKKGMDGVRKGGTCCDGDAPAACALTSLAAVTARTTEDGVGSAVADATAGSTPSFVTEAGRAACACARSIAFETSTSALLSEATGVGSCCPRRSREPASSAVSLDGCTQGSRFNVKTQILE